MSHTTYTPGQFKAQAETASQDQSLRRTYKKALTHFRKNRKKSFKDFPQADAHREQAFQAKNYALQNMPSLLREFEQNFQANGGHVHWAVDSAQAVDTISRIAGQYGVKRVVKGKSMITEEIQLNTALEQQGLEVWESDLAELILQLAHEPPSHIVAPSLHINKEQVAEIFQEHLGESSESIEGLTRLARKHLRKQFLSADMVVTGVNMAVARTGSLVLVENEGNIRMGTTCAPVHVAVMSLEKVVATHEHAAALLKMLPRSATGQKLSSYTSIFTGPRKVGEQDGAEHVHVVILDNGRSRILADPALRSTLTCLRCAACLNVCPVYRVVGGLSYGQAYAGPIGALLVPQLLGLDKAPDLHHGCTSCGACAEVCPVKIKHPDLFLELRRKQVAAGAGKTQARIFSTLAQHPRAYRMALDTARKLDPEGKKALYLPGMSFLARFAQKRKLPSLKRPFYARWNARQKQGVGRV